MSIRLAGNAAKDLDLLFQLGSLSTWTDAQLVTRFLSERDGREAAFRALVIRHGPMVLGVCQRVLDDPHAADDAFQATFMVLVKKARTLRDFDRLTSWLYGVANRIARKAKASETRRRAVERQAGLEISERRGAGSDQMELRAIIDEEISRLPAHYRLPLILCHLEGMQHQEAAERLGCPVGTVESRLSRAREKLRTRLMRRGLLPTAGGILGALMPASSRGAIAPLVEATTRAALAPRIALMGAAKGGLSSPGFWFSLKGLAPRSSRPDRGQRARLHRRHHLRHGSISGSGDSAPSSRSGRNSGPEQSQGGRTSVPGSGSGQAAESRGDRESGRSRSDHDCPGQTDESHRH